MTTEAKTRTITLTDRPPVRIRENEWPQIASATGDSYGDGGDGNQHEQALSQGQLDEYVLKVRQHADGRVIIYGLLDGATAWTDTEDRRGGELLNNGDHDRDIPAAIRRVGEYCQLPDRIIRECIASLPAQEI